MKSSNVFVVATVAATLLLSPAVYASPINLHAPLNAMFAKDKNVKLSLQNDFKASVELKVGEKVVTLEAGKSLSLNLPVGTRIVANSDTSTIHTGTLITEVSYALNGATIHIN